MKILQKLKISRELARLERKAKENPSPSTYVDLAQVHVNLGSVDETLRVAEEGLALFPNAEELKRVLKFAKKSRMNTRIRELRSRINKSPAPVLYRELASIYLELGDFSAVQGACEECLRRFPEDSGALLVLGQARLKNFYRDLTVSDGLEAVACLEKAFTLDQACIKAARLLAEVFYRVGAIDRSRQYMERLRGMEPDDKELQILWQEVKESENQGNDLENLFREVEARGRFVNGPPGSSPKLRKIASNSAMSGLKKSLMRLADTQGVRKAAYIKGSKALVRGEIKSARDPFLRAVRVISRSAQRTSRRMDIGSFNKGVLDGPFGQILLCSLGDVVASVLAVEGANTEMILSRMQDMVAGALYAGLGRERT